MPRPKRRWPAQVAALNELLCEVPEYRRDEFRRRLGDLFRAHIDHRIDDTMLAHRMRALFDESSRRIH